MAASGWARRQTTARYPAAPADHGLSSPGLGGRVYRQLAWSPRTMTTGQWA
jgi:hypothetical protein